MRGAFGTWTLTYTAGSAGIVPGGGIAVVPPCVHSVRWRLGHVIATTSGGCGVSVQIRNDYPLKYHHAQFPCVFVTVEGVALQPGEEIAVTIGDAGSYIAGFYERARAQEVAMTEMYFQVLVDVQGNASYSNPALSRRQSERLSVVAGIADCGCDSRVARPPGRGCPCHGYCW